jgi:hypothetical protein
MFCAPARPPRPTTTIDAVQTTAVLFIREAALSKRPTIDRSRRVGKRPDWSGLGV